MKILCVFLTALFSIVPNAFKNQTVEIGTGCSAVCVSQEATDNALKGEMVELIAEQCAQKTEPTQTAMSGDICQPLSNSQCVELYNAVENALKSKSYSVTLNAKIKAKKLGITAVQEVTGVRKLSPEFSESKVFSKSKFAEFYCKTTVSGDETTFSLGHNKNGVIYYDQPITCDRTNYRASYGVVCDYLTKYVVSTDTVLSAEREVLADGGFKLKMVLSPDKGAQQLTREMQFVTGVKKPAIYSSCEVEVYVGADYSPRKIISKDAFYLDYLGGVSCKMQTVETFTRG